MRLLAFSEFRQAPTPSLSPMLRLIPLVALLFLLALPPVSAKTSGEAPHIHHTYFPEHLSKLFYFKDPKMLLGLDRTTGKLYRSHDHGKKWDHVTEIPSGKASRLYGHPFEDKIAFVLSAGTEHWLTRDEGKTWEAFGTPLPPTSSGEHVLGFHATRTGWILFTGERCKEDASGWWPFPKMVCQDEAFYTKDGFKEAAKDHKSGDKSGAGITSLLGANKPVGKCIWAHQNKAFETMAEEAIFCLEVVDAKEAQKSTSKRSLPMHAFGTSPQMSPDRLHIRDFIYPNSRRRRSNPRVSGFPDENVSDQSGLAKRNVIEDAISAMELRSRYIVRLVSSENFFDTKKIVHFGTGNDGHSGDAAGGGVIGVSIMKDYLVAAISHSNSKEMDLFISVDGHTWAESYLPLPPGAEADAYTILESTEHAMFVDVVISTTKAVGSLFRSNSNGTYYTQSLEHTHRDRDGFVDVERVQGVEGVVIANQVSNWDDIGKGGPFHRDKMQLRSRISFNDGARWRFLRAPEKDIDGKKYGCTEDGWKTGECALHVHSVTSTMSPGKIFGTKSSSGVIMAVGNVGPKLLKWSESDTFLSRDGGVSWTMVHRDAHHTQIADSGAVLVLVNNEETTDVLNYSLDGGDSWEHAPLNHKVRVHALTVDDDGLTPVVLVSGIVREGSHKNEQIILAVNFSKSWKRQCSIDPRDPKANKDIEQFVMRAHEDNDCVMGHKSDHFRRKADAQCHMGLNQVIVPIQEDCTCSEQDFECDYNYALNDKGKCELVGDLVVPKGECLKEGAHFMASSGYRLIPGDSCTRNKGKELDKPIDKLCPRVQAPNGSGGDHRHGDGGESKGDTSHYGPVSHHISVIDGEIRMTPFPNSTVYMILSSSHELYRSEDEGGKWTKLDLAAATKMGSKVGKPVYMVRHTYDEKRAFVYTDTDHLVYTPDRGNSWTVVEHLPSAVNALHVRPIIDFNPENPDWLLFVGGTACPGCHTEIWMSKDNGKKWNRITTHATKCLFARSKQFSNLPAEAVVCANYRHTSGSQNEQDRKGKKNHPDNYLEIRVFDKPFEGSSYRPIAFANPQESDVLDFYIYSRFLVIAVLEHMPDEQGHTTTHLKLYVSEDGNSVHEARFPPGVNLTPEGFTLLPTHGGTIIVDVEGAPSTGDPDRSLGWGTLFASNSNGTHFHLVIEHTNRNHMGFVDFDRVEGTEGLLMANRVLNTEALGKPGVRKQVQTVASRDDGRTWRVLEAPLKDSHGKAIDCVDCTLNLYGHASIISAGPLYGTITAPGYMMGVGSVGAHLGRYNSAHTYLSRDAGVSWSDVRDSETQYEFGDHGGLLVLIDDDGPTDTLWFSYDAGISWKSYKFTDGSSRVVVDSVSNGLTSGGQKISIIAREVTKDGRVKIGETWAISVDFTKILTRQCKLDTRDHEKSDFELWTPHDAADVHGRSEEICVFGQATSYWRRKPSADCWVGDEFALPETRKSTCKCTVRDFECDEGFWLNDNGECALDGADPYQPKDCREGSTYTGRSGYKKVALSQCSGGYDLEKPVQRVCGRSGGLVAIAHELDSPLLDLQYFRKSHHMIALTERSKVMVSLDEGAKWSELPVDGGKDSAAPEKIRTMIRHPYFDDYAYFLPESGTVALYTSDEARTTRKLHIPTSPAHFYQPVLRFHPERPDWIIFLGQPNEKCQNKDSLDCQVEAFVSKDHGAHWDALAAPVGSGGCSFLRTDRLTKAARDSIVCARHHKSREGAGNLVVSDNWFTKNEHVLVSNASDFTIMGEFLLISEESSEANSLAMHISLDGKTSALAKFPGNKQKMDPAYTVLEPPDGFEYRDEKGHNRKMPGGGLMMHVTKNTKPGAEYGTIYASNSNGTYYRQTLEHVNRDESGLVDFERIRALEGVAIANIVSNIDDVEKHQKTKKLQTVITMDSGARWHYLAVEGRTPCRMTAPRKGDCALHLHGYTEVSDPENIYSASGAVGLIMGVGNVGPALARLGESDTYLSQDGGAHWQLARKGAKWHEFGDHGGIIVVADRIHSVAEVEYSLDRGKSWQKLALPQEAKSMRVEMLTTTPDSTSRKFLLYGKKDNSNKGILVSLDFVGAQPRMCKYDPSDHLHKTNKDDFELFAQTPIDSDDACILGRKVQYYRRIGDRECYVGDEFRSVRYISEICDCTEKDYECNFNFVRANDQADDNPWGKCVLVKGMQAPRTNCTEGHKEYFEIEAPYRKIPQSVCKNGLVLDRPTEVWCPGKARAVAIFWSLFLPVLFLGLAYFGYKTWRDRYPYLRLEDIGSGIGPAVRDWSHRSNANSGVLKQMEPVFIGAVATVRAAGGAIKDGVLWGVDRAAPFLPASIQRWSYEHPPRWGASLTMDGRSRRQLRRGEGSSRYSYHPLNDSEAASRIFGTYDDAHEFDEYDEFEAGFNHFLDEEGDGAVGTGEGDAQPVDRQVLFANTEFSGDEDDNGAVSSEELESVQP